MTDATARVAGLLAETAAAAATAVVATSVAATSVAASAAVVAVAGNVANLTALSSELIYDQRHYVSAKFALTL